MKKIIVFTIFHFSFLIYNCLAQQPGWEIIPSGTTSEFNSIHYLDPFNLYLCGDLLMNFSSTDSGSTWQVTSYTPPVTLHDIFVIDQNTIVTVGDAGTILRSVDGGNNWTGIIGGITDDLLAISFADSFGISTGRYQTILYTSDGGTSWAVAQNGYFGEFSGAYMLSPQIGFVAGVNSIFQPLFGKSTDSGHTWDFIPFYLNNNEGRATGVDFTDLNTGYVSARVWDGTGAIAKTTNGGSNWITTFFSNPLWSVDFPISGASLVGYAVGSQGTILKTYNAGTDWQQQISSTSLRLNKVYFLDLDNGFAVGENGIILRTTTGGEPVTIVENENHSPYSFELFQNYPNPFNPSTKIKFTIPLSPLHGGDGRGGLVTLKVYDILGNEIATLINEELPAGEYEVEFSGKGGSASGGNAYNLPSGIYFYTLKAGNFSETKKLVLLK